MSLMKQTEEPLFPDILWNQPVNRRAAGRLLIIGGHARQFSRTQTSYQAAGEAGAGETAVILPKSLQKVIGALSDCIFVTETPAGSLSRAAESDIRRYISESDAVLMPGELSQNTETIGLLESLLSETETPCIITDDIIRSLIQTPDSIARAGVLVGTPQTFSELAKVRRIPTYVKSPDLQKEQKLLQGLGEQTDSVLVCYSEERVLVSDGDRTSMTPIDSIDPTWLAAYISVFYMQHTQKFEAVTTAVWQAYGF